MKCPQCNAWSAVRETRGDRRRRECANGHRFSTEEVTVVEKPSRHREIADAVVVLDMTTAQAAQHFCVQSVSYVRRCVRMHYPEHNYGLAERRRRDRAQQLKEEPKESAE